MLRLAAALVLATFLVAPPRAAGDESTTTPSLWPWGASTGEDGRSFVRKDWYNLGLLGAKASAAEKARGTKAEVEACADRGPDRLRVEALFPDGPAAKAGLAVGDVIVGLDGKPFDKGSLAPLAKALVDAESGATKGVSLLVERGPRAAAPLVVAIPVFGKDAATPTRGKARLALVDAALAFLASRRRDDGGYAETLSGTTGSVVQASVAGLAWLAAGSDLAKGAHAAEVRAAFEFVRDAAGKNPESRGENGANNDQTNWAVAHAAIFLGELHARSPDPDVAAALKRFGDELAKRQETSGGWAHGPGGPNVKGYVELNIMSGLSLLGMGLARGAGWSPPAAVVANARKYVEDSSGGDGGVGYSTRDKGPNIGRSAVMWMAYDALGFDRDKWTSKMGGYVKQHAGDVFGGHASLMQHFLFAGLASQAIGGDAAKGYWSAAETSLVLARAPDGSFQPRPWHESVAIETNADVAFGDVWTTAAWTIVLCADGAKDGPPGLPAVTGRNASKSRK